MARINTRISLRNDSTENWAKHSSVVLLKGEMGVEFDNSGNVKLKIGDGITTWANLPYFNGDSETITSSAQVFQVYPTAEQEDIDAITEAVNGVSLVEGDMAIVKRTSAEKTFHTAYVYDDNKWAAMDGNYNADNVYFDEDLITTTAIGNISLTNGQATIASTGKNLKEVWEAIFVKEQNPETEPPEISFSVPSSNKSYEVGTTITPSYVASLSSGNYSFGPETGVTATSWKVQLKNGISTVETLNVSSGEFTPILLDDNDSLTIYAEATYNDGTIPVTNRNNKYSAGQIKAGTATKTCAYKITTYRNTFYGTVEEKTEFTNESIRELKASNRTLSNGSTFTVNVPVGAVRTIIAYPETLRDLTSVKDVNASLAEIATAFKSTTIEVDGANGNPITYKVFYTDYANPISKANTYNVTI